MVMVFFTNLSFIVFIVRCILLLSHFLAAEYYELSKSTSHLLSLPLTLNLGPSLFFYFICLPDNVLCNIALNSPCDKAFNFSQQVEITDDLQLDLTNYWKIFIFFISYFLILKCQDLVLRVIYSSSNIKSCYPELV